MTNPVLNPLGFSHWPEREYSNLSDTELFCKIETIYRDYPLVIELLYRAQKMDERLWLARMSVCDSDDYDYS